MKGNGMVAINKITNVSNKSVNINFGENVNNEKYNKFTNETYYSEKNLVPIPKQTFMAYNQAPRKNMKLDFIFPVPQNDDIFSKNFNKFLMAQEKLNKQAESPDFWTNLPTKILNSNMIDKVYETVENFKKPFDKDTKVIFVALGNPANADEAAKALGLGHKVTYCCATTPHEIKNAINQAGGNLDKIQVMISSKSGSTFESNETYKFLRNEFKNHYEQKGLSDDEINKNISKHFLCLTDKNPSAKLKKEAIEKGYATVDCVDNLASGFGDLAYDMPLLAYAGVKKSDMVKMIKTAETLNKNLLNNKTINNPAAQIALFDLAAKQKGIKKEQFIFHDTTLDLSSTIAQLYRESLRKVNLELNTYPRAAHSGLQSAIDRKLSNQPLNNITNISTFGYKKPHSAVQLENAHIMNAKNEGHWQKIISFPLSSNSNGITTDSLATYLTLKSHVAYYKNELENNSKEDIYKMPYVNGYKKIRESLVQQNI